MNDLELLINKEAKLIEALEKLNQIKNYDDLTLFVYDENKRIIGSVTDGDLRRSLIKNKNFNQQVGDICNKNFSYLVESDEYQDLDKFKLKGIKLLPILNSNFLIKKVLDLTKIKSILPLECVIMAGGRGKRLSPLTDKVPKPMLQLGNKPIIEHNIDRIISFGIKKIYISVKYLGEQIKSHFGDGSSKGIEIEYIWEDKPLGTAGSLSLINKLKNDNILLINSDLFTNVDFNKMYKSLLSNKADMVVASTKYKVDVPYAVFDHANNNKVSGFKEKPSYTYYSNAGVYIFKRKWISFIPKNSFFDITDLMELILNENKKIIHEPILGYWVDIGSPNDYKNAKEQIKYLDE